MGVVRWEPGARVDLQRYRFWLRREAGASITGAWIAALLDWVDELEQFPERGAPRDDLGRNVRTRVFRKTVTVAYVVKDGQASILHLFGRGHDISAADFQEFE